MIKVTSLNTFKFFLIGFFVYIFFGIGAAIAIPINFGGYENDPFADVVYDYSINPPSDHLGQDLSWALGAPGLPTESPATSYIHLGKYGYITLQFTDNIIQNEAGNDFQVIEERPSSLPDEYAIVSVSQDGTNFFDIGNIVRGDLNSTYFDLDTVGIDWIEFVRITDDYGSAGYGDGFEVDAVVSLNQQPVPEPTTIISFGFGLVVLLILRRKFVV